MNLKKRTKQKNKAQEYCLICVGRKKMQMANVVSLLELRIK